jgi:GAF domain-containing protein
MIVAATSQQATMRAGMPALNRQALFQRLGERVEDQLENGLLTILVPDIDRNCLVRIYSSDEEAYPLGDADIIEPTPWFNRLLDSKEPVIANNEAAIEHWLPDFVGFREAGYGALANLPVLVAGEVVGIVNVMARAGELTGACVDSLQRELPTAALAIMLPDSGGPGR